MEPLCFSVKINVNYIYCSCFFSVLIKKVYTRKMMAVAMCYELNCVPLKNYVEVLTLGTCECDLFWTLGLYRCCQVQMRSLG